MLLSVGQMKIFVYLVLIPAERFQTNAMTNGTDISDLNISQTTFATRKFIYKANATTTTTPKDKPQTLVFSRLPFCPIVDILVHSFRSKSFDS
jgi:hypothetical protein